MKLARHVAFMLATFVVAGCSNRPRAAPVIATGLAPAPTVSQLISEPDAIATAIKVSETSDFHFTGASQPPTNVQATLLTLDQAWRLLLQQGYAVGNASGPHDRMVWAITMQGQWPRNFPPVNTGTPPWKPWQQLAIILDARTGELLETGVP